jgi:AGZA family xanthine/uracil permease-like MFS transporter
MQWNTGQWTNPAVIVGLIMFVATAAAFFLQKKNGKPIFPGAVLLGILATAIVLFIIEPDLRPSAIVAMPESISPIFMQLQLHDVFKIEYFPYVLVFFMGDFFSTTGTALSCAHKAGFMKPDGSVERLERIFYVDSLFSVIGAVFGLTTVTTYVESASGVEAGGRTKATSLVTAFWMLVALFFSPLFLAIPGIAVGVGLAVVGLSMMKVIGDIIRYKDSPSDFISVLFMIGFFLITLDFAAALCACIIFTVVIKLIEVLINWREKTAGIEASKIAYTVATNAIMFAMALLFFVTQILNAAQ